MENKINLITHQHLILLYGYSYDGASARLTAIRASLGKERRHILTVIEFCRAEDIKLEDFDLMMERAMTKPVQSSTNKDSKAITRK